MTVPKLYIDEDSCDARLIAALRRAGFDVFTADEAGTRGWDDERQLAFAASMGRVILTANAGDFAALQRSWGRSGRHQPGIVIWKRDRWSPERFAEHFARVMDQSLHALANAIMYL